MDLGEHFPKTVLPKSTGITCLFDGGPVRALSLVDNAANFNVIRFGVLVDVIVARHMDDDRTFLWVVYVGLVVRLRFCYMWLWSPCFLKVNVSTCFSSFRSLPLSFTCRSIRLDVTNYPAIRLSLIKLVYYEYIE